MSFVYNILKTNKKWLLPIYEKLQVASLKAAAKEQNLEELVISLKTIVPDLTNQYVAHRVEKEVMKLRVRTLHAFQIQLVRTAFDIIIHQKDKCDTFTVADIGDSSGTHLTYIRELAFDFNNLKGSKLNLLSVSCDPIAVKRIESKGIKAVLCRAEDLYKEDYVNVDLFLSFQMIEHLENPISFLDSISKNSSSDYFVITVPYLKISRVGLHHIRRGRPKKIYSANTHIFELCPQDWRLIFNHSGWKVLEDMVYFQYPKLSFLRLTKPLWKTFAFEGFYGAILKKDRMWANYYHKEVG